jgi:transglutaminase-like putative cysteine protease
MESAMIRRKWPVVASVLLVIVLLALNLYVFFSREWESSFSPASYATLYYPLDVPTIRRWDIPDRNRIRLDLAWMGEIKKWTVLTDGGKEQPATGMSPSFRIDTTFSELHTYRLVPVPKEACLPVEVSIRFYSREFYASLGLERPDVYVVRPTVPCGDFDQYSVADWVDDYSYVGKEGLAAADRIVREEAGIRESDPTFTKLEKLTRYLRPKLKCAVGVPKDDERWENPLQLYNEMIGGTGKGWCTEHARVWVFWANRAGVPTRFVFNARTQDNRIAYSGHAFAESYIREQGRWAYADLSQGQCYITNREGQVLNTAELFQLNQQNAFDSTYARLYVDWLWEHHPGIPGTDTIVTVPLTLCNIAIRSEFPVNSILKYRRPPNVEDVRDIYTGFWKDRTFLTANLERYLFKPQLAYSFYPTEGGQTYFIRRALFFSLIVSIALWMIAARIARKRKQTQA